MPDEFRLALRQIQRTLYTRKSIRHGYSNKIIIILRGAQIISEQLRNTLLSDWFGRIKHLLHVLAIGATFARGFIKCLKEGVEVSFGGSGVSIDLVGMGEEYAPEALDSDKDH